ncbi:MAG: heparinase II/III family protein, partial [Planctomycetes bacterium]|nr:heparinase II/III family protein [Planctomycetota bacterium]
LRTTRLHFQPRGPSAIYFEGRHESYDRRPISVLHRRAVISLPQDVWLIVDDLLGHKNHTATVRWHLMNVPFEIEEESRSITLSTARDEVTIGVAGHPIPPTRFEVVWGRDTKNAVQGFASPYYGRCEAIPTVEFDASFTHTQRLITVFSPGKKAGASFSELIDDYQCWEIIGGHDKWKVNLAPPSRESDRILLDQRGDSVEAESMSPASV